MKRIVAVWISCILLAVLLLLWTGRELAPLGNSANNPPLVRAEFSLETAGGRTVTAQELRGSYLLVYFGFTHCPDICPTTLLKMRHALDRLGDTAKRVQPIFISVDPARDTPEKVAEYVKHFDDRLIGLSGTAEQVRGAADAFKVYYQTQEDESSAMGYQVDHSGFIYLMDPEGKYLAHYPGQISEQELSQHLRAQIR